MAATVTVVPLRLKPDALPDHEADELTSTLRYSVVVPVVMPFHFVYFGRLCDAVALRRLVPPDEPIPALPAADNDGVALSVSVPPEPPTPFHVHVRVRVAAALMEDVPPLAAIVAGLADTVTFQALHDAYCLFPADWVIVQPADLPAWVAVYVILRVLVEVLLPALTVFPARLNPAALPEMTGVAVSVPVFTPLVYTSRTAEHAAGCRQ